MGGVQSGTHTLGEALWVHERQRQKCHREEGRHEAHSAQSTQDRRKLLKRTRSLAVISEDESRQDREAHHFRLGQSTFNLPRRHPLIPRAKLIDRNSLKDRLSKSQQHLSDSYERFNEAKSYYSRSACGLHSIPPGLATFPDPLPYARPSRADHSDRLNILDWPESPRRYHSVQDLETVSGLVDIVEDNWPIEGNRSIDCIYTQVKRKRKEHRSLDSILFEDDGELEYFDVLNLLPLSNVRLEFDEEDARNNDLVRKSESLETRGRLKALEYLGSRATIEKRARSNATDEEKCTGSTTLKRKNDPEHEYRKKEPEPQPEFKEDFAERSKREPDRAEAFEQLENEEYCRDKSVDRRTTLSEADEDRHSLRLVNPEEEEHNRRVEEAEDYKSIWISDTEEHEDMSRRPQVLKIVDNDVTKRRHCRASPEIALAEQRQKDGAFRNQEEDTGKVDGKPVGADLGSEESPRAKDDPKTTLTNAKTIIEQKPADKDPPRNKANEGRFERIVKGTSSILGKACSVVKGSLGFEARSESSDLGLGSESGSDTRRRSVDDGIEDDQTCIGKPLARNNSDSKKGHSSLTRSKSCVDSIESHQDDGQEFDHVRYKIVKSNMFSKNMYNSGRGDVTYEGLMQYLREYSFHELLLDNNVVIIEPVRAETIERKPSTMSKTRSETTCKIAGAIQKKSDENRERNCDSADGNNSKSPKQSSIKKHFFYHPIRVNRELIDEELPDPDTVRNVRRMFENTLKMKSNSELTRDGKSRKSVSMKDLSSIDDARFDEISEKIHEGSRSRCSSRAKNLTRLFENMEKSISSNASVVGCKDELDSPRSESKTRILAQSFEARSGHTSPSDSTSSKNKVNRYHHHHHHHNWDAGSISSGVSSDYPDTDPGSGVQCISSEDEEVDCHEDESNDTHNSSHYVSQDVLKKIRECGTSVTYYGGKVVNSSNGPLIAPVVENRFKCTDRSNDYVKFRLVKSNSCDSRLELTGRLVENHLRCRAREKAPDLTRYTIAETPSIEITTIEKQEKENELEEDKRMTDQTEMKREPPVVIGLEPKKEDNKDPKAFKADFKLGPTEDAKSTYPSRFIGSALTRWQVNENNWRAHDDFGKMEFEEFEVLEDSLNATDSQRPESP